jgi:hypothetical protein
LALPTAAEVIDIDAVVSQCRGHCTRQRSPSMGLDEGPLPLSQMG